MPLVFSVFSQASLLLSTSLFAETSVYRCSTPDGKVEFRQTACADGSEERAIRVEDEKTGWEPPDTGFESKKKRAKESGTRNRKPEKDNQAAPARQEEKCWKKRRALEEVNWKLRRGYRPEAGVKLRHKRRTYEDYLRQFCK